MKTLPKRPCPFCGGSDALEVENLGFDIWMWAVVCCECGAQGPRARREDEAVSAWDCTKAEEK